MTFFQYSLCLLLFFLLEMGVAIVGFIFPTALQSLLEESFTDKIIQTYREDPDLQNFIDFGQQEVKIMHGFYAKLYEVIKTMKMYYVYIKYSVLCKNICIYNFSLQFKCCGLSQEGYLDWGKNEYFNCTSPSVERCGVPFSCCINATDISVCILNVTHKIQKIYIFSLYF